MSQTSKVIQRYKIKKPSLFKGAKYRSKCSINDLSHEVLLKVFAVVPADVLLELALVCRKWRDLANDCLLWEKNFKHLFGVGSLYKKLKQLSLSNCDYLFWKKEYLKQCQIETKKFLSRINKDKYTGITFPVRSLKKLGISFDLVITDNSNREYCLQHGRQTAFRTSTVVQWNSLNKFPVLSNVKCIRIFALAPYLFKKDKIAYPSHKSLVYLLDFNRDSLNKKLITLGCDNISNLTLKTNAGMNFGLWGDTNDLAFISVCLHNHNLLAKCTLATVDKVYTKVHKQIPDDIDPYYGLHGYQCHILVHSSQLSGIVWEHKFNYLPSCKDDTSGYVAMTPDSIVSHFNYFDFVWKVDLFSGKVKDVVIVDITMMDSNNEIIWAKTYPSKINKTSTSDVLLNCNGSLYSIETRDQFGMCSITFSKEDNSFSPIVILGISKAHINKWFGKNY